VISGAPTAISVLRVGMSMLGLTKKLPDAFRRLPGDLRHASARLII
jgi:hypothetical protein